MSWPLPSARIELRISAWQWRLLLLLHALGLAATWFVSHAPSVAWALTLFWLLSLLYSLGVAWQRWPESWIAVTWHPDLSWRLVRRDARVIQAQLRPDSRITRHAMLLRFDCENSRWPVTLLLWWDGCSAQQWQLLHQYLGWVKTQGKE